MRKSLLSIPLSALFLFAAASLSAGPAEERGLAIAKEGERRDTGFHDFTAAMEMLLRNAQGEESLRTMRTKALEGIEDGDKTLIVFDQPRDVAGTALLTYTHKQGEDDQWLYLPALKRVKRIASRNKSGPFMGSEFAYEDLASQEIEKYNYRFIEEQALDGQPVFLVERVPVDENSGYSYQLVWIDQSEYRPMKIEFYDRKKSLLKTLTFHGYRQYLDKYWRADEMNMVNHQTGKSTSLRWHDYQFQVGLGEADFSRNSLKRAK